MKVYHPTNGSVYEGEPVDCRELMQKAGYTKEPAGAAAPAQEKSPSDPTVAQLDEAIANLPSQISAGQYRDAAYVVNQMSSHFGDLFDADRRAQVEAMFPEAPKPINFRGMKKADLHAFLDEHKVAYETDANNPRLAELCEEQAEKAGIAYKKP
jgi:hypothetical protein